MENKFEQIAQEIVEKLNAKYGEKIFELDFSCEHHAEIINTKYRWEGNDVNINIDEDGITGSATSLSCNFTSVDDVLENIDSLFINAEDDEDEVEKAIIAKLKRTK